MRTACLLSALVLAVATACSSSSGGPGGGNDAGNGGDGTSHDTGTPPGDDASPETASDAPPSGDAGDTWANYAEGFFMTYCVECHNPTLLAQNKTMRDYTTSVDVVRDKATIRCGVAPTQLSGCSGNPAPRQFPISDSAGTNPKPADAERLRLVAWIEAGTPL
jgi:hypothetical protein